MATASLDTVGFLASPAQKSNRGSSDLLEGQLFAYGCGSGVVVVEVQQLQVAATLEGVAHKGGAVTAVKWCPMCHSRDLISETHLRLASGDSNGGVAIWDVQTQCVFATLDDALLASSIAPAKLGAIHGLEWVAAQPLMLAVLMAPATLLIWDTQGGTLVWQRELSSNLVQEPFSCMCQDPLDQRRLCATGRGGQLALITLNDIASGDVAVKHFKIEARGASSKEDKLRGNAGVSVVGANAGMQAVFACTRGLLFVLLPREIQVLDMELGVPAASRALPSGRAPFVALLGVYGRGVSQGGGDEGGSDCVYALHADASLTIWLRVPGELRYTLSCTSRLMPPLSRNAAQSLSLLAVRAQIWKRDVAVDELVCRPWLGSTEEVTGRLQALLLPDSSAETAPGSEREAGSAFARTGNAAKSQAHAAKSSPPAGTGANTSSQSLLIMSVTSDGKVWQWDAPLPRFSDRSFIASVADTPLVSISGSMQPNQPAAPAASPMLVGMLHTLPHAVTTLSMFPKLLATGKRTHVPASHPQQATPNSHQTHGLPPKPRHSSSGRAAGDGAVQHSSAEVVEVALMGAAVTVAGNVELFTMTRGQASPLAAEVAVSLNVHRNAIVQGVRWLGATPRLVSFTVERVQVSAQQAGAALAAQEAEGSHPTSVTAWKNLLAITDVRTRRSTNFREVPPEPNPLLGMRASPSGSHLLLLIKGAPAELWRVSGERPARLRLLDLPFTAVEWMQPAEILTSHLTCVDDIMSWHQQQHAGAQHASAHQQYSENTGHAHTAESQQQNQPQQQQQQQPQFSSGGSAPPGNVPGRQGVGGNNAYCQEGDVEEKVAFTLGDGRAGVLSVCGRHVADARARRPVTSSGQPMDAVATAIAAWGHTVVLGDSWGQLGVWDTLTGKTTTMPTGFGTVRRILVAPAPHPSLYTTPDPAPPIRLRLACLFSGGQFGVYELDAAGHMRAGHASPLTCTRIGRVLDLAWLNLPWLGQSGPPSANGLTTSNGNGSGCVLAVVTDNGSIALLDAAQASDRRPSYCQRMARLSSLLSYPLPLKPRKTTQPDKDKDSQTPQFTIPSRSPTPRHSASQLPPTHPHTLPTHHTTHTHASPNTPTSTLTHSLSSQAPTGPTATTGGTTTHTHGASNTAAQPGSISSSNSAAAFSSTTNAGAHTGGYNTNTSSSGSSASTRTVCAVLAPPRPVGSALLLWRPWALLLRLLLQLGVSQECLLCCCSRAARLGQGLHAQRQRGARASTPVGTHVQLEKPGVKGQGVQEHAKQQEQQKEQQQQQQQQQSQVDTVGGQSQPSNGTQRQQDSSSGSSSHVAQQQRALEQEQALQDKQWAPWPQQQMEAQRQQELDQMRIDAAEAEAEEEEVKHELLSLTPQSVHEALLQAIDPSLHAPSPPCGHAPSPCERRPSTTSPLGSPSSSSPPSFKVPTLPSLNIGGGSSGMGTHTGEQPCRTGSSILSGSPQGALALRRAESAKGNIPALWLGAPLLRRLSSGGHGKLDKQPVHGCITGGWAAKQQLEGSFQGDLLGLIAHLGRSRAQGRLLHPEEWRAYLHTLAHHNTPLHPFQGVSPPTRTPTGIHPHATPHTSLSPTQAHTPPTTHTTYTASPSATSTRLHHEPSFSQDLKHSHPHHHQHHHHQQYQTQQGSHTDGHFGSMPFNDGSLPSRNSAGHTPSPAPTASPHPAAGGSPASFGSAAHILDLGCGFRGGVLGVSQRMAVAAKVSGDAAEVRFWTHLPSTLQAVVELRDALSMGSRMTRRSTAGNTSKPPPFSFTRDKDSLRKEDATPQASTYRTPSTDGLHGMHTSSSQHFAAPKPSPPGRPQPVGAEAAAEEEGPLPPPPLRHPPPPGSLPLDDSRNPSHSPQLPHIHTPSPADDAHSSYPSHSRASQQSKHTADGPSKQAHGSVRNSGPASPLRQAPRGFAVKLWDEDLTLAEAQEHTMWHEALSRVVFEEDETLQEKRMLEYVVLGDFQTAVAFLLASTPEKSARYYRDALVTTALAAAANARPEASTQRLMGAPMQIKAAKVISAHASSVGDTLLAVPLHCSAGLYTEAVGVLQECGLWRYAAHLTAHALTGIERAEALQKWADHVLLSEGNVWGATGILVAAGCLREALQVLLEAGLPDCAAAFMSACLAAGLAARHTPPPPQHSPSPSQSPTATPPHLHKTKPTAFASEGGAASPQHAHHTTTPHSPHTHTATATADGNPNTTTTTTTTTTNSSNTSISPTPNTIAAAASPPRISPPQPQASVFGHADVQATPNPLHTPSSAAPSATPSTTSPTHAWASHADHVDPLVGLQLYSVLGTRPGAVDAAQVQRLFEAYVVGLLAHI